MARGVGRGDLVAVAVPRGAYWPLAVWAVTRAGAAWVSVDVHQPPARSEAILADSGATVAVLCGTDKRYDADAGPATAALRAAGISTVLLAGPEKAVGDVEGEARPDGFLTAKIDAIAALTDLLNTLGA